MKLIPLKPPLEEDLGGGVSVIVTHAGIGLNGLPRARISIWNGRPLAGDVIEPDAATERRRLAKAAIAAMAADSATLTDAGLIDAAILRCAEALHACEILIQPKSQPTASTETRPSADFPGLVDIVLSTEGEPQFLVLCPPEKLGVSVVAEFSCDSWPEAGVVLVPPPIKALPWLLPRADEVLGYLAPGGDSPSALFDDIVACIKARAFLPSLPAPHADAYYELCAAWVFHTHLMELANYSPELAFYAVPERGKSRLGRTLIYLARRGVHTETLREANLFRDSQDRGATLFLDCMDLWQKASKMGCEDILLQRFERGARVSRVLYPERGAFHDTVYYDIFGPTILASNDPIGRILDTRCIAISMPLAPGGIEYPVPNEAELLPLRERLTAWRARQLIANWQPATMAKPAPSRLGDVLLPLLQIIAHVAPARIETFRALASHLEGKRRQERSLSWEAAVVAAISELADRVDNGLLLLSMAAERVNAGRAEKEQLSNRMISQVLHSLGLETRKAGGNKAALAWDDNKVTALAEHYADLESKKGEQKDNGVGSADANHANYANGENVVSRERCGEGDSVVSIVSFRKGDESQNTGAADTEEDLF